MMFYFIYALPEVDHFMTGIPSHTVYEQWRSMAIKC